MKTLADFRRAIKLGVRLTLVHASFPHKYEGTTREVVVVQKTQFALVDDEGNQSWLDYPKASEFHVLDPYTAEERVRIDAGRGYLVYRIEDTGE